MMGLLRQGANRYFQEQAASQKLYSMDSLRELPCLQPDALPWLYADTAQFAQDYGYVCATQGVRQYIAWFGKHTIRHGAYQHLVL